MLFYNLMPQIIHMNSESISTKSERKSALIIASFGSFLTPFMGSFINVALPRIGEEFGANAVILSWVATAYLLAAAVFLIPFGRLADIYGRKKIFLWGIIIFTVSSVLCAFSQSVFQLIAFRVLQALGSAMIFTTAMAIITSIFPISERGKAIGIIIGAVYIGLTIGPFAGGFLTEYLGWRSIFFILVPLGLIAIALILIYLKNEWAEASGEKFDWFGSVLYAFALTAIMLGLSELPENKGFVLLATGFLILFGFIYWEFKHPYPVLDLSLFKNNITFRYSNIAALINYSATFAMSFLLSLYLQYIKGLSPRDAGLILVSCPIIMAVFAPVAGRLSDKIDPGIVASIGMALSTIGLIFLALINADTSLIYLITVLIVMGFGFAFFSSPNTNAIMTSVEKRFYGIASGSVSTMRLVGQMLSMGIAMLLFTLFIGKVEITPENFPGFLKAVKTAFVIFAILCFIGVFASLARGKVRT